jgi:catechol 2,3-dioxygenase-like lactoylglutathione lyase family enzyme
MAQTYYRGRLLDHVHLRVRDLDAAKRFYRAVLGVLGREVTFESDEAISFDELWIDKADERGPTRMRCAASTRPGSPPAGATTARRASVRTITQAITPASCSIRTDTTSRQSSTGQRSVMWTP